MAREQRKAFLNPGMRYLRKIDGLKEHLSQLSGIPLEQMNTELSYAAAARIIRETYPEQIGPVALTPIRVPNPALEKLITGALKARAGYAREKPDAFAAGNAETEKWMRLDVNTKIRDTNMDSLRILIRATNAPAKALGSRDAILAALTAATKEKAPKPQPRPTIDLAQKATANSNLELVHDERPSRSRRPKKSKNPFDATRLLTPTLSYAITDARSAIHLAHYMNTFRGAAPAEIAPEHKNILAAARKATGVKLDQKYVWSRDPAQHAALQDVNDHIKRHFLPRYIPGAPGDAFTGAIVGATGDSYYAALVANGKFQLRMGDKSDFPSIDQLDGNERSLIAALPSQPQSRYTSLFNDITFTDLESEYLSPPGGKKLLDAAFRAGVSSTMVDIHFIPAMKTRLAAHRNMALGRLRLDTPVATQDLASLVARSHKALDTTPFHALAMACDAERPDRHVRAYASAPVLLTVIKKTQDLPKTTAAINQGKPVWQSVQIFFAEDQRIAIQKRTAHTLMPVSLAFTKDINNKRDYIASVAEKFHQGSPKSPPLPLKEALNLSSALESTYINSGATNFPFRDDASNKEVIEAIGPLNMAQIAAGLRNAKGRIVPVSTDVADTFRWLGKKVDAVLYGTNTSAKLRHTVLTDIVFPEGRNQAGLERLSADWHRSTNRYEQARAAFETEVRQRQTARLSQGKPTIHESEFYPHIITAPIQIGKVTIAPLASAEDYFRESKEMDHCISSYRDDGAAGTLLAFSVTSEDGRSTPGYTFTPARSDRDKHHLDLLQHQGANTRNANGLIVRNYSFPPSHGAAIEQLIAQTLENRPLLDEIGARQKKLVEHIEVTKNNDLDALSKAEMRAFDFTQLAEFLPREQRTMTPDQWVAHCKTMFEKHTRAEEKILAPQKHPERIPPAIRPSSSRYDHEIPF